MLLAVLVTPCRRGGRGTRIPVPRILLLMRLAAVTPSSARYSLTVSTLKSGASCCSIVLR